MAYIPPHKRPSSQTSPTPFGTPRRRDSKRKALKILYSEDSISRWVVIPRRNGDDPLRCPVRLKPFFPGSSQLKEDSYMILEHLDQDVTDDASSFVRGPWVSITETIQDDLLTSFQAARVDMCKDSPELNVPRFVIRFGKILFDRTAYQDMDHYPASSVEEILEPVRRRFYTNIPNSFREDVLGQVIPKVGLDFVEEKEHYYVKVFDKTRPEVTISCKCSVTEATGELNLYKMELNELRQMVADISCLKKNLDLRLLLSSKRILTSLTDDERNALNSLVKSAVVDSEVKGGLRWPLGKESVGKRYVVVGAWHTISKVYSNSFMMLKIRHADRFDFRDSTGDIAQEVSLRIPALTSCLRDAAVELSPLIDTVRDGLKLVWENFMCWEGSFA